MTTFYGPAVDRPPHYTSHPSGIDAITIIEHMNFCLGNVIKYVWRAGAKGDRIEDLKKARWYLDREIARLEHQPVANVGVPGQSNAAQALQPQETSYTWQNGPGRPVRQEFPF